MPACRIYWFDQDDHVSEADYLIADADDDVRAGAVSHLGTASAVEVWHWARRVVRVSGATRKVGCRAPTLVRGAQAAASARTSPASFVVSGFSPGPNP